MIRRVGAGLAWAAIASLASSCATDGVPAAACGLHVRLAQIDQMLALNDWRRGEAAGVVVYANASDAVVRDEIGRLDAFLNVVSELFLQESFEPRRPLVIYLFDRREQFAAFGSCGVGGHTIPTGTVARVGTSIETSQGAVLQHELVHAVLLNQAGRAYPPWFHEGLAELLGAAVIRSDVVSVGAQPMERIAWIREFEPLPLGRLLSASSAIHTSFVDTMRFYADAWAFVHYGLLSHTMGGPARTMQFTTYVRSVSLGSSWNEALVAAFGAPIDQIEREYRAHRDRLRDGRTPIVLHLRLLRSGTRMELEPIAAMEIATALGLYALDLGEDYRHLAAALFDQTLRRNPDDTEAAIGRIRAAAMRREFELAETLWTRLERVDRESLGGAEAAAALALARYAAIRPSVRKAEGATLLLEAREQYQRVLSESPQRWSALVGFGDTFVLAPAGEDPSPGIAALERALMVVPRSPALHLKLARLCVRTREYQAAATHLRFVIDGYPESTWEDEARDLLEELPAAEA